MAVGFIVCSHCLEVERLEMIAKPSAGVGTAIYLLLGVSVWALSLLFTNDLILSMATR
jgi:hypothetical protein